MRTALDTNVLSALWSGEPTAHGISTFLGEARAQGRLVICAPVFVEALAHPLMTPEIVEQFLGKTGIAVDFDLEEAIWREAASSFAAYARRRRRSAGDPAKRLLVDFIVGAHALCRADRLMTLDPRRYNQDFPNLRIV